MADKTDEIRRVLNNLNLGTSKLKVGDIVVALIAENADLKARVAALELAAAGT